MAWTTTSRPRLGAPLRVSSRVLVLLTLLAFAPGSTSAALAAAALAVAPPTLTAQSAVLIATDTGKVLWSMNQHARRPIASTAKLMTALVTTALADPDELVVVQAKHLAPGSTAGLRAEERISIRALLHALLVPSDNAAGLVLADHVGQTYLDAKPTESIKAFVRAMNARAQQMGLTNTRYETPFGNGSPTNTYSSAHDLAQVGQAVLADPLLAPIVMRSTTKVTGLLHQAPIVHDLVNTNRNLCAYAGTYGVKTGWNEWADQVLIVANRRGDTGLTAVVMGSADSFADTRALLAWGYTQLKETAPAIATCQEASVSITYTGPWSRPYHSTYAGGYVRYTNAADATVHFRFHEQSISWIAPKGVSRGQAAVYLDGVYMTTVDLYAPSYQPQQVVFLRSGLPATPHTLEIRTLSTTHPSATGTRVDIDAFVVQGPAVVATTTAAVNLRAGQGTSEPVVAVVPAGTQLAVHSGPYQGVWYKVGYQGTQGYIHGAYLRQGSEAYRTTIAAVNLRAGPSTSEPVLGVLPQGAQVTIHRALQDDRWYEATYQGIRGYIHSDYLQ